MIKKISHVGLAVDNLAEARAFFDETFDLSVSAQEQFGELLFSFISLGETDLELLQSTTTATPTRNWSPLSTPKAPMAF
jgi:catechol 2,3-dioxygenase-like lactoylglutathione lyase family enzyme